MAKALALCALGWAQGLAGSPLEVRVEPAEVGRFERVEFTLRPVAAYRNPYDDDEVAVDAEITAPDGRVIRVPGFFEQPMEHRILQRGGREVDWLHPTGFPVWRIRFAPSEVGRHACIVGIRDASGKRRSRPVEFTCVASPRKGYIRVARADPRYLEHSTGEPFFAIGHNIAFIGPSQHVAGSADAARIFARMAESGANYARIWACCEDWAMAIEARKSAWGRSWSWKPPIAPRPEGIDAPAGPSSIKLVGEDGARVTASPTRPLAVRPGTRYRLAGRILCEGDARLSIEVDGLRDETPVEGAPGRWIPFSREIATSDGRWWLERIGFRLRGAGTIYLGDLSLREADGGPELLWQADVNRPIEGRYDLEDAALLDRVLAAAEASGIRLQITLVTRDLYMEKLKKSAKAEDVAAYDGAIRSVKRLLRYAVARWGWSTHVAAWEYFNEMDPGRPTDRFYRELGEYLEAIDPYGHLRATSAWAPNPRDWAHPELDTADMHFYLRPVLGDAWKDAASTVAERAAFLRERAPSKPALLAEFGLAQDKWGRSEYLAKDARSLHLHDGLWASAMAGLSGGAMAWWWEDLDGRDRYGVYEGLSAFVARIPFAEAGFRPAAWATTDGKLRIMALLGEGRAGIWIRDPAATWWRSAVDGVAPTRIDSARIEVPGGPEGSCRISWWDTYEGRTVRTEERVIGRGDSLPVPAFARDIACQIVRIPR
ncbi:MAG: DUF5060 domain-containing protein [Planctomycetes bacterium]|nr:DUF5060 domain-containing protein [Planctomycetota bacterium]